MPTAAVLRLAGILDEAGFGLLEVSGGGVFDSAVRRGVESPWERIRAIRARTRTPLGMALRGRLLVGSRPVDGDFVRRFVASAAESGIDVFRLHDPLNDVSNLRDAAEAIEAAGREVARPPGGGRAAARRADRPDPRLAGAPERPLREPLPHPHRRAARPARRPLRRAAGPGRPDGAPGRRAPRRRGGAGGG